MDFKWLKQLLFLRDRVADQNSSRGKNSSSLEEVYVFPLPNSVLFPGTILPLHIFEERYKLMMNDLLEKKISLAMSHAKSKPDGGLVPSTVCGAGKVNLLSSFPDGRKDVFVQGQKRLKLVKIIQETPYIKALAEPVPDIPFDTLEEENKYHRELLTLVKRWIFLSPELDDSYIKYVDLFSSPHYLSDFIASAFLPTGEEKQNVLEMRERKKRVETIMSFINGIVTQLSQKKPLEDSSMIHPIDRMYH